MTKKQLSILATLPQVIEALDALNTEQRKLREALTKTGMGGNPLPAGAAISPAQPAAPSINHRAAQAWADDGDVTAAIQAEQTRNQPKPVAQLPAAQRRAIQQGFMQAMDPERAAKLAQFKKDAPTETRGGDVVVESQEITTLAEAT